MTDYFYPHPPHPSDLDEPEVVRLRAMLAVVEKEMRTQSTRLEFELKQAEALLAQERERTDRLRAPLKRAHDFLGMFEDFDPRDGVHFAGFELKVAKAIRGDIAAELGEGKP